MIAVPKLKKGNGSLPLPAAKPNGGFDIPNGGGAMLPDGGIFTPSGGAMLPDGGTLTSDGGAILPDGGKPSKVVNP